MKRNWKLYGITIGKITIIPCYYDVIRWMRIIPIIYKKNFRIINFSYLGESYINFFSGESLPKRNGFNLFMDNLIKKLHK